ncbi:MAG TPA: Gfo/Idh/MocA family oxidoreductase, partial [Phycisphaerae bacterium]|nr:Gfo/Idh/MocA family oxidoreductase [Phycisphaerae bacterium]
MGQCAHLRNYVNIGDCEVTAIAELRENTGVAVARRYGIEKVYKSHEEMLASEQLDAIVASQFFGRHGVILNSLIDSNLPIFIEKPLAASIDVAQEIVNKLSSSKSKIMVGYHKRSDPATEWAKAEIDRLKISGELGPMKYIRILMPAGDWIAGGFAGFIDVGEEKLSLERDPPQVDMDDETGGKYLKFVNYYIHQVNLMRFLLGERYSVTHADPSGVLFVGQSSSGVPCTIEMTPYRTTIGWQESAMVCFEKGYVKLELPAPLASNVAGTVEV